LADDAPLILAFDTAAAHCAAALVRGDRTLVRRHEPMDRGQAERLLPMLGAMLAEAGATWRDLAALGVCTGPGNFTGLRVGVAAARGLALGLGIPAVGVSVFETLAARPGPVLVTLADRRGGGVFAQAFRDGAPLWQPAAFAIADLPPLAPGTLCLGFAAGEIAAAYGLTAGSEDTRAALELLARIAANRADSAPRPVPLYLRPADATPSSEPLPRILDDA
jgi:tRNA threonylcarbamoyl adenosine modification protein YeaZ